MMHKIVVAIVALIGLHVAELKALQCTVGPGVRTNQPQMAKQAKAAKQKQVQKRAQAMTDPGVTGCFMPPAWAQPQPSQIFPSNPLPPELFAVPRVHVVLEAKAAK